jgi:ABC-type nitrate/sulfonate/bicarbonate transport system permease component
MTAMVMSTARRGRRVRITLPGGVSQVATQLSVAVSVVALWELAVRVFHPRPDLLPAPSRVWSSGWADRTRLWDNLVPTLQETLIGLALAFVVAAVVAGILDFFPRIGQALLSLFVGAQAVPIVAVAPLMVIWFGFGMLPKVILIIVATFFPLTIAILEGLRSADGEATRLLRSLGANRFQVLWHLRLPSSLPFVFTGLRVVTSYAVTAAIFAEYVGSEQGLGIYLLLAKNSLRTDLVFAVVIVVVVCSVALFAATDALERLVAPWQRRQRRAVR